MRAALSDHTTGNWGATAFAWIAGAAISAEFVLIGAFLTIGIAIVAQCTAAVAQPGGERSNNCCMKLLDLAAIECIGTAQWVDAGAPECLVGVDIADPRDQCLVEQQGFDGAPPPV